MMLPLQLVYQLTDKLCQTHLTIAIGWVLDKCFLHHILQPKSVPDILCPKSITVLSYKYDFFPSPKFVLKFDLEIWGFRGDSVVKRDSCSSPWVALIFRKSMLLQSVPVLYVLLLLQSYIRSSNLGSSLCPSPGPEQLLLLYSCISQPIGL